MASPGKILIPVSGELLCPFLAMAYISCSSLMFLLCQDKSFFNAPRILSPCEPTNRHFCRTKLPRKNPWILKQGMVLGTAEHATKCLQNVLSLVPLSGTYAKIFHSNLQAHRKLAVFIMRIWRLGRKHPNNQGKSLLKLNQGIWKTKERRDRLVVP